MITDFYLENFKSYRKATLRLAPLTLLIGTNASGKSNAIEGMRFLSLLAEGRRLDDIFQSVQREDVPIRGTMQDLTYDGSDKLSLGCSLRLRHSDIRDWKRLRIGLHVNGKGMRIVSESIDDPYGKIPVYTIKHRPRGHSHEVKVVYNNFARGRNPEIPCTDQQAIFLQLDTPSRFSTKQAQSVIPAVVKNYRSTLRSILFLDPEPRRMREYSFITDDTLLGDGRNLSSVLYSLCKTEEGRNNLLGFIRNLPEQDITDIKFLETPRREVMLQLTETFAGHEHDRDAPVLKDGTLRIPAVAAALLSAPRGSLVVIEEIDNGVHPSRAEQLLQNIQRIAKKRSLRVLLTSHNPALLDTIPTEAVPDVVCCYRDPQMGDSRLISLEDLPDYPELVAQGPLGQLMTHGIIERFLKERRSPEEKKEAALRWLSDFQEEMEGL